MIAVVAIAPAGALSLAVDFNDGTNGVADFSDLAECPGPFAALKDPVVFAAARIEWGTVCWPGGLDLAVEAVYARAHKLPHPKTTEDVDANERAVRLREAQRRGVRHDIPRIKSVDTLPGTRLAIVFDDGSSGVVDLSADLERWGAKALADPAVFTQARARVYSVTWEEADVDADGQWLYALVNNLRTPLTDADVRRNAREVSLRRLSDDEKTALE